MIKNREYKKKKVRILDFNGTKLEIKDTWDYNRGFTLTVKTKVKPGVKIEDLKAGDLIFISDKGRYSYLYACSFIEYSKGIVHAKVMATERNWTPLKVGEIIRTRKKYCRIHTTSGVQMFKSDESSIKQRENPNILSKTQKEVLGLMSEGWELRRYSDRFSELPWLRKKDTTNMEQPKSLSRATLFALLNKSLISQVRDTNYPVRYKLGEEDRLIKTKTLSNGLSREDGYRILVSRYKPKGFDKPFEPWSIWVPSLAPNRKLHNQWQNKEISLEEFKSRYLEEMKKQEEKIRYYAEHSRVQRVTLVCSCKDKDRCHTSLLKTLMEKVK